MIRRIKWFIADCIFAIKQPRTFIRHKGGMKVYMNGKRLR